MSESALVERSLLDLVSFIVDNRGRSCPVTPVGFPLIATNCLSDDSRRAQMNNIRYVDEETYSTWFRAHPEPNDVLFVCKGNPGRVALVPDPVPYCIAQDMVALRANPATVDPLYLYYRLASPDTRKRIENMHVGTLIPHFKKGDFGKLLVPVHPMEEQRRIASVLGALDDLIEANREMIGSLVAMAVDVLQRRHGRRIRVGDIASLSRGLSYKGAGLVGAGVSGSVPMVNLANFSVTGWPKRSGLKYYNGQFKPSHVLRAGDLLIANTDLTQRREILGRGVLVPPDLDGAIYSHHTSLVTFHTAPYFRWFLWAQLQSPNFRERALGFATGTTVTALPKEAVLDFELDVPEEAEEVADIAEAILKQTWALEDEIADLARTRDELLPLLMSGKVRVSEDLAVA